MNSKAIWYIPQKKFWLIGELSRIGKDYGSIFGSNGTSGDLFDENIVWNYFNDGWKEAEANDIDVHCLTKEGNIRIKRFGLTFTSVMRPAKYVKSSVSSVGEIYRLWFLKSKIFAMW